MISPGMLMRVKGQGLVATSRLKTSSSYRVLSLPEWAVELLLARRERLGSVGGPVFPSTVGGFRDPSNTGKVLRLLREGSEFEWVRSHTFRKTVATLLDEAGMSARLVADQLGHARISMTQDVYMGRRGVGSAAAKVMEKFTPPSGGVK